MSEELCENFSYEISEMIAECETEEAKIALAYIRDKYFYKILDKIEGLKNTSWFPARECTPKHKKLVLCRYRKGTPFLGLWDGTDWIDELDCFRGVDEWRPITEDDSDGNK